MLSISLAVLAPALLAPQQEEPAPESSPWKVAFTEGDVWLKFRYRFEYVDQDGVPREGEASTLRTVVGYRTPVYEGFSGLIEFEDVTPIGNEDYDPDPTGPPSPFPVVADPDGTEVNQVYVQYDSAEGTSVKAGRQRITLDNHRFVGNVGWRQNEQTFDAASVTIGGPWETEVYYAFLHNVNRIFGDDSPIGDHRMASHLLNVSRPVGSAGDLIAYAYHLDYDDVDAFSTTTFGARLAGKTGRDEGLNLLWAGEAAKQIDAGNNPGDVDAIYYLAELGANSGATTVQAGYEVLGGSSDPADTFQTPLATGHKFNGWADKFLSTPAGGLEDVYVSATAKLGPTKLQVVYHDFQANDGGMDYGTELDASLVVPFGESVTAGLKYANYMEDGFATDTTKAWAWLAFTP